MTKCTECGNEMQIDPNVLLTSHPPNLITIVRCAILELQSQV